jgi:hypothetical protein
MDMGSMKSNADATRTGKRESVGSGRASGHSCFMTLGHQGINQLKTSPLPAFQSSLKKWG